MDRRKFLLGLGVLPFLGTSLFSTNSAHGTNEFVLVGLGDAGDSFSSEIKKMGFKGKVYGIQVTKSDNLHIRQTERLLHGENLAEGPNFLFSTFTKQNDIVPIFVAGLGGIRSTYLAALAYHEMTKLGRPFHMFLTTPFNFEGSLRNSRAKRFRSAMEPDSRIKCINLNDCPRDVWPTIKQGFTKFPPQVIYQEIQKLMG